MAAETNPPTAPAATTSDDESPTTTPTATPKASSARPGKAGRTNYDQWHKVTRDLVQDVEQEEADDEEEGKKALGLGGKYARSQAEEEERQKAKDVRQAKKVLDRYQKRESAVRTELRGLLGPVLDAASSGAAGEAVGAPSSPAPDTRTVRVTRDMIDAGKRVVNVADTSGSSPHAADTIVLTSDLSLLESKMKVGAMQPKTYAEDAENDAPPPPAEEAERKVYGIIKIFLTNLHNCTVLVKCKVISGTLEMNHCSNVAVRIERDATIATVQADLCQDVSVQFHDAPSGKNMPTATGQKRVYWGEDVEDRILHAGVKDMKVQIYRDGYLEAERLCDYVRDGARSFGNATEEEFQFVTSCSKEGELMTEAVVREGSTTGQNARPVTRRELDEQREKREKAASMAAHMAENMIKFKEVNKEGAMKVTKKDADAPTENVVEPAGEEEEIEEVYASMSQDEIAAVVKECEQNKARGNEAFGAGEYAQAILLYSLALDKADELPDSGDLPPGKKQLFPRDVLLSNRSACFLKMGQHERAVDDAKKAREINPQNIKALFRHGLALHAMKDYQAAIPILAEAHKLEPKNKQIKEALQFAEVRMNQDLRKRMEG